MWLTICVLSFSQSNFCFGKHFPPIALPFTLWFFLNPALKDNMIFFIDPASTSTIKQFHLSSCCLIIKQFNQFRFCLHNNFIIINPATSCTIKYFHQSSFHLHNHLFHPSSFHLLPEIVSSIPLLLHTFKYIFFAYVFSIIAAEIIWDASKII